MPSRTSGLIGGTAIAAAVVIGVIVSLQNFDAEKVSCDNIDAARASLQETYDAGVNASVQVYAGEKAAIDDALSSCLSAKPVDPCADAQKARDAAVANYNGIPSPPDNAPYPEFQSYFKKRDDAYNAYKKSKDALDQCRTANPPKPDVPYEKSDTKACFDAYDKSVESIRDTFEKNTQAMRTALKAALAALDAREKACNPPGGKDKFTDPTVTDGGQVGGTTPVELQNCQMINPDLDTELFLLRRRAAAIPGEIQAIQDGIDNAKKRMGPLQRDLKDVDTYIPPESAKTQFEGALNALRAERKVSIEASLEFYQNLITRREAEKAALEKELADLQAQIAARLSQIQKENETRQRSFPTAVHLSHPDKCAYYHCHGMLCGRADPAPNGCGHGTTTQSDVDCKQFIKAYLQAAGVN
jgi:hypothetical protein